MTNKDSLADSGQNDRSRPDGNWNHQYAHLNGNKIHYVREGQGPVLFLLHGWPEFWWSWHQNMPALAEKFELIVPDLRGFGESVNKEGQPASLDGHAHDIIALADHLGIEEFGLVSHDVGAYITQHIARICPERLKGLFFFNAPYPGIGKRWVDSKHVREIWYQSFNQLPWAAEFVGYNRDTCRLFFQNMLAHWSHNPGAFEGHLDHWVDNFMKDGNIQSSFDWYSATHEARMALVRDGAPDLPKINIPSRFFWGHHDPVILSEWTDKLPDYFENPIVELAENAGHFVHFECPGESNERIITFFENLPRK